MTDDPIAKAIRDVPDFPKPGIVFKDISPVIESGPLLKQYIDELHERHRAAPPDIIAAIDARGFLFAGGLADRLGCGIAMIRKKGNLPWKTREISYALEYGEGVLEMQEDTVSNDTRVLLIDDVLATGGTARAAVDLIELFGGAVIAIEFLLELTFLNGRDKLKGYEIHSRILVHDE